MADSLLVVEGAHDASFFGHLLKLRGYVQVRTLSSVPDLWRPLIPQRYPIEGDLLDRVIRFPEIHVDSNSNTFGIIVAGGEDRLVPALRTPLERLGTEIFVGIGVVLDADHRLAVADRFRAFVAKLAEMNAEAQSEPVPGFPIALPTSPGAVAPGPPRLGIHILPDNLRPGTLETVLLECAAADHAVIARSARLLINYVDRKIPLHVRSLDRLRSASGRAKAEAGIVANVLQPGSSLAVSLRTGGWLGSAAQHNACVKAADNFLFSLIYTPLTPKPENPWAR